MSTQDEPRIRALIKRVHRCGGKPTHIKVNVKVAQRLVDLGLAQWSDDFSELVLR